MVSLTIIQGDNPNTMCPNIKDGGIIVASLDGVLKSFGDSIQVMVWKTHPPDEFVDVGDILLMWFSCYYDKIIPWSFTSFGLPVGEELLHLLHNYFRFIWAICRFLAAYRF